MDDARVVGGAEPLEHVVDDRADLAEGEVLLALEPVGQGLAGEVLEDEEVGSVVVGGDTLMAMVAPGPLSQYVPPSVV